MEVVMRVKISKIMELMHSLDLKAMIVSDPHAIFYVTGKLIHPGERFMALVLQRHHEPVLYLPHMFQIGNSEFEVIYYQDHEKPLLTMLNRLQIEAKDRIGVDKDWPARFLLEAMALLPDTKFVNGSAAIDLARLTKSEDELGRMYKASEINDAVMSDVAQKLCETHITETDLVEYIAKRFLAHGASGASFDTIVCFGKGSSEPHHESNHIHMVPGAIIVDMGCVFEGYCSDMTRSFYYGEPPKAYLDAYQAVLDANLAAIAAVKPGVPLKDVDAAARELLTLRGYGEYFVHRTGHGIGISVHEYPDVSSVSEAVCEVGMVFSIEPGVYLPDDFGIRIEDLVQVTEDGCKLLNAYPKELHVFGASQVI